MPPPSSVQSPLRFDLRGGIEPLRQALLGFGSSRALDSVLELVADLRCTLAYLEDGYVDRDYTDEFVHFYASTYRPFADRCKRLHFFRGDMPPYAYLGYCVLRPIRSQPVGRTLIRPRPRDARFVSCRAPAEASAYGESYGIRAFPFMEQDSQYGVCAHVSVWMVAMYHHLLHRTPRREMSEIAKGAESRASSWQAVPSGGLSEEQLHSALQAIDLPPIIYDARKLSPGAADDVACRYLNSRFPVLLTVRNHVTVLVGYGRDQKGDLFFVRSDESRSPYQRVYRDDDPLGRWSLLMVPRPGRIYMPGEVAEQQARWVFTGLLLAEHSELWQRLHRRRQPLRLRSYIVRSDSYKVLLAEREVPLEIASKHRLVSTSDWIWVTELQDPDLAEAGRRCVLGEVAIDATSHEGDPNYFFANLPGAAYVWNDEEHEPTSVPVNNYEPYLSGTAIHDAPVAIPAPRSVVARARGVRRRLRARATRP
jgi:hypothetical protein